MSRFSFRPDGLVAGAVIVVMSLTSGGCESGSAASEGAKRGATTGAVSGAVGGLVSALVFGGDPVERAARGAVYGGTTGAVAGAMAGSQVDKSRAQAQQNELDELRQDIGSEAFEGLASLAECRYDEVIRHADKAMATENPNYARAGLWLEVLAYADQRDETRARALFPSIIEIDWEVKSEAQAEAAMRRGVNDLMDIRERYGLPRVCGR